MGLERHLSLTVHFELLIKKSRFWGNHKNLVFKFGALCICFFIAAIIMYLLRLSHRE